MPAAGLKAMRSAFRRRTGTWVVERIDKSRGPLTPPLQLTYRRIFTLPTGYGLAFGLLLFVMVVGSLNFNNNLALVTTFMLTACTLLSLLMAYRNMTDIWMVRITAEPVFAGQVARFRCWMEERDNRPRPLLQLAVDKPTDCVDLPALGNAALELGVATTSRGLLEMPDLLRRAD